MQGPRSNLEIWIDGKFTSQYTPAIVRPLPVGPHVVEVRERGGDALASRRVGVKDGPNNVMVEFRETR